MAITPAAASGSIPADYKCQLKSVLRRGCRWFLPLLSQAAVSPDGRYLATGKGNGTVSISQVDKLD
jgi:hypothetical protein